MPPASAEHRDARIGRGMRQQLAARDALLASGAHHRGWKVGFTTPASRQAAAITQSLLGYLTDATELQSGATVDLDGWRRPVIEAELAIVLAHNVEPTADAATTAAAIGALATAIEVVDLTVGLDDVERVLACDIFHRHFVLGPPNGGRVGGDVDGIRVLARLDDELVELQDEPCSVIGALPDVVRFVAAELDRNGLALRAGDVVMAGSAIPLTPVTAGQRLQVEASTLGVLELRFESSQSDTKP